MFSILLFAICSTVFGGESISSSNYTMNQTMDQAKNHTVNQSSDFAKYPEYTGEDLGITWSKASSKIKVWAPTANAITWRLYENDLEGKAFKVIELRRGLKGIWSGTIPGNWEGKYYTVQALIGQDTLLEVADPYAICVGRNGKRGQIIDLAKTNPKGWENDLRPELKGFEDVILYEVHIRDLTSSSTSGALHKGKYKGFAESNTRNDHGVSTGLDHIAALGVTHVHLLPIADFASTDETLENPPFNWGYEPLHYNVPEGSYSSNPADGAVRIKELKELIAACHKKGISVVLDVVYNHTTYEKGFPFEELAPGYWYRQDESGNKSNASGCGNETATERIMVQKYIRESLRYWVKEYHVDGFRFDLMGIHDIKGMNLIRQDMDAIDPSILLYGEGWTGGASPLPGDLRALKANMKSLPGIAAFSDDIRDVLKGHWSNQADRGFVSGKTGQAGGVRAGLVGGVAHPQIDYAQLAYSNQPWVSSPLQTINYVSCHDNNTLADKLLLSNPNASDSARMAMHRLANTVVLLSQGIPFLHAGVEFGRTKQGDHNSYKSSDTINGIDWNLAFKNADLLNYHKNLIAVRKAHPVFRMTEESLIEEFISFPKLDNQELVLAHYDGSKVGDSWKEVLLILNGSDSDVEHALQSNWLLAGDGAIIYKAPTKKVRNLIIPAHSAVIVVKL